MKEKPLHVIDCPLCRIFSHGEVKTKLYWPNNPTDIPNSEFVIVDCETCKSPMVVVRDHVEDILSEQWGRILFKCRKIFGANMKLRCKPKKIFYHYHCHLENRKDLLNK